MLYAALPKMMLMQEMLANRLASLTEARALFHLNHHLMVLKIQHQESHQL
jgi:hypothetical protein